MKIYRTQTVLTLSTWDEKRKAFIEITPSFEGASKGQPKPGEKRYDYDKTLRISFQPVDMLTASYKLISMAHGDTEITLEKFGDMAKVANSASTDKKKLMVKPGEKGVGFYLSQGEAKVMITLNPEECYAIGMWFQFQAQKFINIGLTREEEQHD
jgi:hypothetical protein